MNNPIPPRHLLERTLLIFTFFFLSACVQKMGKEGHLRPLEVVRTPPIGTVPQEKNSDSPPQTIRPVRYTKALLEKGREQYQIYCMPCHGMSGYGDGMIVQRGFLAPPSYHSDRLRNLPDQHYFEVITQGYGAMYSYADRVSVPHRWAIIGYIRALQLSQNIHYDELSISDQKKLDAMTPDQDQGSEP